LEGPRFVEGTTFLEEQQKQIADRKLRAGRKWFVLL
jgi:hypothetical protein